MGKKQFKENLWLDENFLIHNPHGSYVCVFVSGTFSTSMPMRMCH